MQDFLQKLRENPRIVVVGLISAGVIALALGNSGDDNNNSSGDDSSQEQTSSQMTESEEANNNEQAESADVVIGSEPSAGPVEVEKEETMYSSTVRAGDNQTVVARQMVNEYLSANSQSLSAEQRLFVETTVVDSLPRNDVIFVGDVISVEEVVISDAVAASGELAAAQIKAWSAYL